MALPLVASVLLFVVAVASIDPLSANEDSDFEQNIKFFIHNSASQLVFSWTTEADGMEAPGCSNSDPLSFVIPGWKESSSTEWVPILVQNLFKYRGGCVIVVDYSVYGMNPNYPILRAQFDPISKVIEDKFKAVQDFGYPLRSVFVFAFSFGSQLALEVGRKVNNETHKIARMDLCEPTGLLFWGWDDSKLSAGNVQCIHTNSVGFGRTKRDCHQDWNMGSCGDNQAAEGPYPKGSHGLCPFIYNSAFENSFYARRKDPLCDVRNEAETWSEGFKMGYNESRFENNTGEFFAQTFKDYPYTKDVSQNVIGST